MNKSSLPTVVLQRHNHALSGYCIPPMEESLASSTSFRFIERNCYRDISGKGGTISAEMPLTTCLGYLIVGALTRLTPGAG
jgi:hypothetical protein